MNIMYCLALFKKKLMKNTQFLKKEDGGSAILTALLQLISGTEYTKSLGDKQVVPEPR